MSKISGHALYRKFENVGTKLAPVLQRRAHALPTEAKPDAPSFKTRAEALARESVEKEGGTFLFVNFKKRTMHYLDKNGTRRHKGLMLDERDKKRYGENR